MNKLTLNRGKATACLILMCLFLVQSCRKDILISNSKDKIENARIWYGKQFDKSSRVLISSKGDTLSLTMQPKWATAYISALEDQADTYIIPLETDLPKELKHSINPILLMRQKGSGYDVKIIKNIEQDSTENTDKNKLNNDKLLSERAFGNVHRIDQNNNTSGNKSSINNPTLNTEGFSGSNQNKIMGGNGPDLSGCLDWWLVTEDGAGEVTNTEYIGRTCPPDLSQGGGGGGGTGGGNGDGGNGNFGTDPNCRNCKVADRNFSAMLAYAQAAGLAVTPSFETTLTLDDGTKIEGTATEIRNSQGEIVATFFSPNTNAANYGLEVGYHYSIGNKGPSGTSNPDNTVPNFYFNFGNKIGFSTPNIPGGGNIKYTNYAAELINMIGITEDSEGKDFLYHHMDIARTLKSFIDNNGGTTRENIDFIKWTVLYFMGHPNVSIEEVLNAEFDNETAFPTNTDLANYVELAIDDSETRIVISPQDMVKYPKFTALVKGLYNRVANTPKIMAALVKYTGFTQTSVLNDLKFDKRGPIIYITPKEQLKTYYPKTKTYGYPYGRCISDDVNKHYIFLNKEFIDLLEAANGTNSDALVILLATTILHEYVHWSDNNFGLSPSLPGEMGDLFEKDAFGEVLQYNKKNGKLYYRKK
ncbi:hypothetical protein [Pedobacter alluvionis]|uniref:Zincin-like metallopeptidase toxin 3 of polymorphic toxin system n=1 Tax=Pedobacter alluvionis TaxID=475253 RepID=A0A497XT43_9SPHI|nr:hypothetical protein [Pedobacter alluvionis]RLJ72499.1 zincin-like metallopeptidase toxin 3 of polymorphic toxin system [Pedobacter alluvionis]TFB28178.1 hypothetical protein E3V97_24480 [Pedobacter alluvionis]